MSHPPPAGPITRIALCFAFIAMMITACGPAASSNEVSQETLDELIELYPEMAEISRDELMAVLSKEAEEEGMTTEDFAQLVIRDTRENDEAMRRAVEGTAGDAPAQSH